MSDVLAIIPARIGSKGIPNKNFRLLAGVSPVERAWLVAHEAQCSTVVTSSDLPERAWAQAWQRPVEAAYVANHHLRQVHWLYAPAPLHTDDCPMIDVIQDVLQRVPGPPEQIIVLLQPTQPLRQPKHVTHAIQLLQDTTADSVVSVVDVGMATELLTRDNDGLLNLLDSHFPDELEFPAVRQGAARAYRRDGTVYAFRRRTVVVHGNIYGSVSHGLIIPSEETVSLDTPDDWLDAERRLSR